jgi:hypothetical protein
MITKQDLVSATKERRLHVVKNFYDKHLTWSEVDSIYDLNNGINYNSFGTMLIGNKQNVLNHYKDAIHDISKIHSGEIMFGAIIIHFINRTNNIINDPDCLRLVEKFYNDNPKKLPEELVINDYGLSGMPQESFDPTIHFDPEDRFFIQGSGQTFWKIFDDSSKITSAVVLGPGDLAYIPKKLLHSVESLSPRHSVTIAFSDDPEIFQA